MYCLLFTVSVSVNALNPEEVGQLLIVDCSSNVSNVPTTENMIVGESLILRCSVNTMMPVNDFRFTWSSNNTILRMINQTEQTQDYYVITQLNTSNDGQAYQCEVIINTIIPEIVRATIELNISGKLSTEFTMYVHVQKLYVYVVDMSTFYICMQ